MLSKEAFFKVAGWFCVTERHDSALNLMPPGASWCLLGLPTHLDLSCSKYGKERVPLIIFYYKYLSPKYRE